MATAIDDYSGDHDGIPQLPDQPEDEEEDDNSHGAPNVDIGNGLNGHNGHNGHYHSPQSQASPQSTHSQKSSQSQGRHMSPPTQTHFSQNGHNQTHANVNVNVNVNTNVHANANANANANGNGNAQIRSPFSQFSNRFHNFQQSFKSSFNEFTGVLNDPSNPSFSNVGGNTSEYTSYRSRGSTSGTSTGTRPARPSIPPPSAPSHASASAAESSIYANKSQTTRASRMPQGQGTSSSYVSASATASVSQSNRAMSTRATVQSFFGGHKRRHSLLHDSRGQAPLPSNFHGPESFVNLLYRIIEDFMNKGGKYSSKSSKTNKFGLVIFDIDNLRGHIQSPVLTHEEMQEKIQRNVMKNSNLSRESDNDNENENDKENENGNENDNDESNENENNNDESNNNDDSNENNDNKENKEKNENENDKNENENENKNKKKKKLKKPSKGGKRVKIAEDNNDNKTDDTKEMDPAERAGQINLHRRKSSFLLNYDIIDSENDEYHNDEIKTNKSHDTNSDHDTNYNSDEKMPTLESLMNDDENDKNNKNNNNENDNGSMMNGNNKSRKEESLSVGYDPLDPYVLFWNNSKDQKSVVKVVQDMILMSVNKAINVTHFGFGEFAIVASVQSDYEMSRLVKKVLLTVSSNAHTSKLGPVTLCAGISMYDSGIGVRQWINQARQACLIAKTNGRGRCSFYLTPEKRRSLSVSLMLEIKKPSIDFSSSIVLRYIRQGADLNFQYRYDTPLMIAIKYKNYHALRYLIQYNYDPNIQDKDGKTALILALEFELNDLILDLLVSKRDLNPRIKDNFGNSALSLALRLGYREISKTLILLGAEPLVTDKSMLEEWFNSARQGNVMKMTEMMDNLGFPIDMIDDSDMTALMHACENGQMALVKTLIEKGANVNIQGKRGYTALMLACQYGRPDMFDYLMNNGALIGLIADDGSSILMSAAKGEMPEVIKTGIENGVNVNLQDMNGNTALMVCAVFNSVCTATELLRNAADFDICNKVGKSALMIAAENGSSQIVSMLITLGASINTKDSIGMTALMYAAKLGNIAIVSTIIKYGGNLNEKDRNGMTAIDYANNNNHSNIVEMIKQGTLTDFQDALQQLEVMRQKNESLQRTIEQLTTMNLSLTDDINKTERQKHQLQNKLNEAVAKIPKMPDMFKNINFSNVGKSNKKK